VQAVQPPLFADGQIATVRTTNILELVMINRDDSAAFREFRVGDWRTR